jgi:hypothetical protein
MIGWRKVNDPFSGKDIIMIPLEGTGRAHRRKRKKKEGCMCMYMIEDSIDEKQARYERQ